MANKCKIFSAYLINILVYRLQIIFSSIIWCSFRKSLTSFFEGIEVCAPFIVTEMEAAAWLKEIAFLNENPFVIP